MIFLLTPIIIGIIPSQRAEEFSGDQDDVRRACKHIINKSVSKRLISKQEAMVLLGSLDLTLCSETIESVSISNSSALRSADEKKVDKTFITKYKNRSLSDENCSIHAYFHQTKNPPTSKTSIIPNFVGINGAPTFPVSETYARHVLIVYRPWRDYPRNVDWIAEFDNFIYSNHCPDSARMGYERVMSRYYDKMMHYDPKSSDVDHSKNPVSDDDLDLIALVSLSKPEYTDAETALLHGLDLGTDYEWDKPPLVRTPYYTCHIPVKSRPAKPGTLGASF